MLVKLTKLEIGKLTELIISNSFTLMNYAVIICSLYNL